MLFIRNAMSDKGDAFNAEQETFQSRSKYETTSETQRTLSVFKGFAESAKVTPDHSVNSTPQLDEPVLTMSSLGQLGRFGNQLFQYAFLRICAQKSGARVACPAWIGQSLFGHQDEAISQRLPPAIEQNLSQDTLFDVLPEFVPYLEKLALSQSSRIGADALNSGLSNVDLWGFFQLHTQHFRPYQAYFRSLFQPVDALKLPLEDGLNKLRAKGKTVIGIHIRRGDYITEPRVGFTLVFPAQWYCQWLEGIWCELEDPVLFLCSDDLESVLPAFEKFSPMTLQDLDVKFPSGFEDLDIAFYTDFFMLSRCDIVCTSNSIFSFSACMLNETGQKFVRPHWNFSTKFIDFDPWDSDPLLWLGGDRPKFVKSLADTVSITYATQGVSVALKVLFIYIPVGYVKRLGIQAYLAYQAQGLVGVLKSVLRRFDGS